MADPQFSAEDVRRFLGVPPGFEDRDPADLIRYVPRCLEVFGLGARATLDELEEAYRRRAFQAQMDAAGGDRQLALLHQAFREAAAYIEAHQPPHATTYAPEGMDYRDDEKGAGASAVRPDGPPKAGQYVHEAPPAPREAHGRPRKTPAAVGSGGGTRPSPRPRDNGGQEKLFARFETVLSLRLQPDADSGRRGLYLAGSARAGVPGVVAFTDRRCVFRSEHLAPGGLLGTRKRYTRIDGELSLGSIRSLAADAERGVRLGFTAHGQLLADHPEHKFYVLQLVDLAPSFLQALEEWVGRVQKLAAPGAQVSRFRVTQP